MTLVNFSPKYELTPCTNFKKHCLFSKFVFQYSFTILSFKDVTCFHYNFTADKINIKYVFKELIYYSGTHQNIACEPLVGRDSQFGNS